MNILPLGIVHCEKLNSPEYPDVEGYFLIMHFHKTGDHLELGVCSCGKIFMVVVHNRETGEREELEVDNVQEHYTEH